MAYINKHVHYVSLATNRFKVNRSVVNHKNLITTNLGDLWAMPIRLLVFLGLSLCLILFFDKLTLNFLRFEVR